MSETEAYDIEFEKGTEQCQEDVENFSAPKPAQPYSPVISPIHIDQNKEDDDGDKDKENQHRNENFLDLGIADQLYATRDDISVGKNTTKRKPADLKAKLARYQQNNAIAAPVGVQTASPVWQIKNCYGSPVRHSSVRPVQTIKKGARIGTNIPRPRQAKVRWSPKPTKRMPICRIAVNVSPIKRASRIPVLSKKVRRRAPPPKTTQEFRRTESDVDEVDEMHPTLNVHASDTDGYDSEFLHEEEGQNKENPINDNDEGPSNDEDKRVNYESLSFFEQEGETGPPIDEDFAKILEKNWQTTKTLDQIKGLFNKYQSPSNCIFEPPRVNTEVKGLVNAAQRTADMQFMGVQKSLAKTMNAMMLVFEEAKRAQPDLQKMAQITTDVSAMLRHASYTISKKRREGFSRSLRPKFRPLCWEKENKNCYLVQTYQRK